MRVRGGRLPQVLGIVSGAVMGLVMITPAAGYVDQTGAFFMGRAPPERDETRPVSTGRGTRRVQLVKEGGRGGGGTGALFMGRAPPEPLVSSSRARRALRAPPFDAASRTKTPPRRTEKGRDVS